MRRPLVASLALLLIGGLASGTSAAAGATDASTLTPSRAAATATDNAADRTFSEISGCLATGKTLLVSVVVDESASLQTTDPSDQRVNAIETAVDALEDLRSSAPSKLSVQVSLSTFARDFATIADWRELNGNNADRLRDIASNDLPGRNNGNATDYRQALNGAKKSLDQRAEETGKGSTCKLMLWFTDGALDVDDDTQDAADDLCRDQGIADAVRSDKISVVALALFTKGGLATSKQREQLRAVAEGTSPSGTCGQAPIPEGSNSGAYLAANDAAALSRLFAGAGALIAGASRGPTADCPGKSCSGSKFRVKADRGVGGFRIVAQVPKDQSRAMLVSPSESIDLPTKNGTSSKQIKGATVQTTKRSGLVTISVTFNKVATKRSAWTIDLDDGSGIIDLYWVWGAKLDVPQPTLVVGQASTVAGKLTNADGSPLPIDAYESLDAGVRVGSQQVTTEVDDDGSFSAKVPADPKATAPSLQVSVSMRATTEGLGTNLGPLTSTRRVATTLPASFPKITPSEIDFGRSSGTEKLAATITLVGSADSDASVCFTGAEFEAPRGVAVKTQADKKCVDVKGLDDQRLRLSVTPDRASDGVAAGSVNLQLKSNRNQESVDVSIPAQFDLERPVNQSKRWLLIAALIVLALIVPFGILALSDWLLNRFVITPTHQMAAVAVRIDATGPYRFGDDKPLLSRDDLQNLPEARDRRLRRYENSALPGILTTRGFRNVIRGSRPVVEVPAGFFVLSGTTPHVTGPGTAPARFGPIDLWYVVAPGAALSDDDPLDATLVVLTSGRSIKEIEDWVGRKDWSSLNDQLRSGVVKTAAATRPSGSEARDTVSAAAATTATPDWINEGDIPPAAYSGPSSLAWLDESEAREEPRPSRRKRPLDPPTDLPPAPSNTAPPPPDIDFLN